VKATKALTKIIKLAFAKTIAKIPMYKNQSKD